MRTVASPERRATMTRAGALVALASTVLLSTLVQESVLPAEPVMAANPPVATTAQSEYDLPEQPPAESPPPVQSPPPVASSLELMSPFPVVRLAGRLTRRGARITTLSVRAPRGALILVRCRPRGCVRRWIKLGRGILRPVRFLDFERSLRAGRIIEVLVGRIDVVGKFTRFRIRRGRPPARRDLCLVPGQTEASRCPDE